MSEPGEELAERTTAAPARSPTFRNRLWRWWDKHYRVLDPLAGLLIGLALAWWLVLSNGNWATMFVENKSAALFTAGSAVTGVLLGLIVAALTIVADHLSGGELVGRDVGHRLVDSLITATQVLGIATVVALTGLVPSGVTALKILLGVWVVATTISIVAFIRAISLLRAIVRAVIDRGTRE